MLVNHTQVSAAASGGNRQFGSGGWPLLPRLPALGMPTKTQHRAIILSRRLL